MKFTESWLRELIDFPGSIEQLAEQLTMAGLEIESLEPLDEDTLVEVSLTPNRGDCLSIIGLAREVAALNDLEYCPLPFHPVAAAIAEVREVSLTAAESCPRYCGRVIRDINLKTKLPPVIVERLQRCGISSINPVVDLANYVMLETGQPTHVFDLDHLKGKIEVRLARTGESIALLDGQNRSLSDNTLVIADESGPVAIAGIMGGLSSAVNEDTRSIFIESAWFAPVAIMGRARQYGLHTDASHRYERGVDPELAATAMERLTTMIIAVCGGQVGPVIETANPPGLPPVRSIRLRASRIRRLLGIDLEESRVTGILTRLGFQVEREEGNEPAWVVYVPSYRFDAAIETDLIEEIARIHGYQQIAGTAPMVKMRIRNADPYKTTLTGVSAILATRGYRESISYSFVDPAIQKLFTEQGEQVALLNPISEEMAVMRQSLWPGLVQSLIYNVKRQQPSVRLFEIGKAYTGRQETRLLGGVIYGNKYNKQWGIETLLSDFYDLKSDIEALLEPYLAGASLEFMKSSHFSLHPGQSAAVTIDNVQIGRIGALHPDLQRQFSLPHPAYLFELELDRIYSEKTIKFNKISKYPSVKRDISVVVPETVSAGELLKAVQLASQEPLINLELFDVYRGEGIDSGKKSLALGLTFQRSSSTLTDEEADKAISVILQSLQERFGALLRE